MAVTIAATQLTGGDPPFSQVVVSGLAPGDQYVVEGTAGQHSWKVQGGTGTALTSDQLILVDSRVPWGGEVIYRVFVGGAVYTAAPLTVAYSGDAVCVFQSLDGLVSVPVGVATFDDPKTFETRRAFFAIPGRRSLVGRHDVTGLPSRDIEVETENDATFALERLLESGAPIVRRQAVGLRDIAPVQVISVGTYSAVLLGAVSNLRVWSLPTQEIDAPELGTVLFIFDWADFDTVYSSLTWDQFDSEWSTKTWDQFDSENWGARL